MRERVATPIIVDADTGYGNALNVQRTVKLFERAGASAIQLEDQSFPKRCGHLADKGLIAPGEMAGKIRAAVDARASEATLIIARTDAVAVEGFAAAIDRAGRYAEAGADVLFVEAPRTSGQLADIVTALGGTRPLMANMVEGGQTPILSGPELQALGFRLVIFPGAIVRAIARTAQDFYGVLARDGTTDAFRDRMFDFGSINTIVGTEDALNWRQILRGLRIMKIDPVTLAVLKGRLEQIADEMDATLYRSAFNPIIAEARDACHGLYHPVTGATLVQGTKGLPIFVGAMAFAVKAVIDKVEREGGLDEGDTFLFNDPYDGGTHLNDFRLVRPVFRNGALFCWLASVGHWLDIGGNVPGGFNARATESFQEGVRIPPVKLITAGNMNDDIVSILSANSRVPQSNYGDLNGQLNALDLGQRRLHGLLDQYGEATITAALDAFTARAEALMRENIAALPDGRISFNDYLDNDGVTDDPLLIALDLTIAGDRMTLDFSRSAPPCAGPLNIARSTAVACCYVALKHVFTDVPANAGCMAPIEFIIPDSTLLGVSAPKPVGGYTETILRVIGVVFGALAKIMPDRATAAPFGTINALSLAGHRDNGQRWVMFSFFGGGLGGNPVSDGLNHGNNPISMATIPPAEILEAAYPVLFTQWALRPDSAGAGLHRGGLGAIYEVEALAKGGADVFLLGERGKFPPFGVGGRRQRSAQPLLLADEFRRDVASDGLQGHRREDRQRATRAPGNARRRRLGRTRWPAIPPKSPAMSVWATSPSPPPATTMPSCSRRMAPSISPRRKPCAPGGRHERQHDRRRRRRRHLHGPVLFRRGRAPFPHRQSAFQPRQRGCRLP